MYKIFNNIKNKKAFTLVELIIVITILVILATIGFINFGNYGSQARDSLRKSDLKNIEKSINLYKAEKGTYPGASLKENGEGEFGEEQFIEVKKLSELPKDPLTKNNYKYILSEDKKIYKLEADLENGEKFILTNSFNYEDNLKNVDNKDELEKLPNEDGTCSDGYLKFEGKCKLPGKMVLSYKGIKAGDIIELGFKGETNIVKIDWGDDGVNNCINNFEGFINSENIKSYDLPIRCIYNNVSKSDYIITVNGLSSGYGTVHSGNQNFRSAKGIEKLERVIEWTDMGIKTFQGGFMGASSLISLPENLDVSKIENFGVMFLGASLFNQNISNWDMSSAKDLTAMFYEASSFNQPLNSWNVSKVKNMDYMFFMAVDFYQDISSWDVRGVPTMPSTFQHWGTRFREHHRKETNGYNNDYLPELWKIKN